MSVALANRDKRSIAVDLHTEAGKAVLDRLLETADVFLTNFRPGALERLGLDAATLTERFPRLVYARGTATGSAGRTPTMRGTTPRPSSPAAAWPTC
jgi:crotonobetainyl-CoA:carnitine CoA-transferase CaiB-like acyl-CoA transferase